MAAARDREPTPVPRLAHITAGSDDAVRTRDDFVAYLGALCDDFVADAREVRERAVRGVWAVEGRWAHGALPDLLWTWGAWTEFPGPYAGEVCLLEPVTWQSCAAQIGAARLYE